MMYILILTNYQNKWIQLVTFFIFHIFSVLGKYQVLIKLATFVWGFQLSKVTSPTAINCFAQVLNTNTEEFMNASKIFEIIVAGTTNHGYILAKVF